MISTYAVSEILNNSNNHVNQSSPFKIPISKEFLLKTNLILPYQHNANGSEKNLLIKKSVARYSSDLVKSHEIGTVVDFIKKSENLNLISSFRFIVENALELTEKELEKKIEAKIQVLKVDIQKMISSIFEKKGFKEIYGDVVTDIEKNTFLYFFSCSKLICTYMISYLNQSNLFRVRNSFSGFVYT